MFASNLLVLVVMVVSSVSARAIGESVRPLGSSNPIPSTTSSIPECAFRPHNHLTHSISQKPISPDSYTNIPTHAWPHITSLLFRHSNPITSLSPIRRNHVETLRLSTITDDVTLESVVLGLVFTVPETTRSGELELRAVDEETKGVKEGEEKLCLEHAIKGVENERQVEGVLDMGKGKMGFLVYRVD